MSAQDQAATARPFVVTKQLDTKYPVSLAHNIDQTH